MKVKASGLETSGVPRGRNISQSQECIVQQVDGETHEWQRISITVLLKENDPHPNPAKRLHFCTKEKP